MFQSVLDLPPFEILAAAFDDEDDYQVSPSQAVKEEGTLDPLPLTDEEDYRSVPSSLADFLSPDTTIPNDDDDDSLVSFEQVFPQKTFVPTDDPTAIPKKKGKRRSPNNKKAKSLRREKLAYKLALSQYKKQQASLRAQYLCTDNFMPSSKSFEPTPIAPGIQHAQKGFTHLSQALGDESTQALIEMFR